MATRSDETKIAILEDSMQEIKSSVAEISVEVKTLSSKIEALIITKIQETIQLQADMKVLTENYRRLEKQSGLWKWLSPTFSAIVSGLIMFLLLHYLQDLK